MASGRTTTDSLADSLPTAIAQARLVREKAGVMTSIVDKVTLAANTGTGWNEISLAALTAQAVTALGYPLYDYAYGDWNSNSHH